MLRFKSFLSEGLLKEYLTAGQREKFSHIKMTDKARKDTDHYFGAGNDLIKEPLISDYTKSETHEDVENHLGISIPAEHYIKGVATDKHGRLAKIGKQIKDSNLLQRFSNDTARSNANKPDPNYVTIVRGTEVAGQTNPVPNAEHPKGHSWKDQSCKNIESGCNSQYLTPEIQEGSVLFRVHDGKTGEEIHRTIIQPYHNDKDETSYGLAGQYGVRNDRYTKHALEVAAKLSNSQAKGKFTINPHVYQDSAPFSILSPHLSSNEIGDILKSPIKNYRDEEQKLDILSSHRNVTSQHLMDAVNNDDPQYGHAALNNPNITHKHIHAILSNSNAPFSVKNAAIRHSTFNANHITDFLNKPHDSDSIDSELIGSVIHNPKFNDSHASIILKNNLIDNIPPNNNIIRNIAKIKLSEGNIHHIIDKYGHSSRIMETLAENPELNNDHIDKLFALNDSDVDKILSQRSKIDPKHVDSLLDRHIGVETYNSERVVDNLLKRGPLTNQHFDNILSRASSDLDQKISVNPNLSSGHIHKLLDEHSVLLNPTNASKYIRYNIANRKDLDVTHADKILNSGGIADTDYLTKNKHLSSDVIHHLIEKVNYAPHKVKNSYAINNTISRRRDLTTSHIDKLLGYNNEDIDYGLAHNPVLAEHHIHHLIDKHDPANNTENGHHILMSIAERNDLTTDHIKKLLAFKKPFISNLVSNLPS